jgi:hypothetical protein
MLCQTRAKFQLEAGEAAPDKIRIRTQRRFAVNRGEAGRAMRRSVDFPIPESPTWSCPWSHQDPSALRIDRDR